jgi:hypothetical protein
VCQLEKCVREGCSGGCGEGRDVVEGVGEGMREGCARVCGEGVKEGCMGKVSGVWKGMVIAPLIITLLFSASWIPCEPLNDLQH